MSRYNEEIDTTPTKPVMIKRYVIFNICTTECFCGADMSGIYFSSSPNEIKKFDTEQEAEKRLEDEFELFPSQFKNLHLIILPILHFE